MGILHTEIAKAAKTDVELGDPSIDDCPILCGLCDLRVKALFCSEFYTQRSQRSLRPIWNWVTRRSVIVRSFDLCDLRVNALF
jgi:hypothetical protein